jgi:hypothetical protein
MFLSGTKNIQTEQFVIFGSLSFLDSIQRTREKYLDYIRQGNANVLTSC